MKKRRMVKEKFKKKLEYTGLIEDFNEMNIYTSLVYEMLEKNQIEDPNAKSTIEINGEDILIKIRWSEEIETPEDDKITIIAKRGYDNSKYKKHIIYIKSIYEGIPLRRIAVKSSELTNDYIVDDLTKILKDEKDEFNFISEYSFDFISKFKEEVSDILFDFFEVNDELLKKLFEDTEIIDLLLSEDKVSIFETYPREKILNKYEELKNENSSNS